MIKKSYIVFIIASAVLTVNLLFMGKVGFHLNQSDIQEVFSCVTNPSDYEVEITGSLLEGNTENADVRVPQDIVMTPEGSYNNTVLRWGLSRRAVHQIPVANPGAPELLKKYGGAYIGDSTKKELYLTFDEGYENGYTEKILDVLKEQEVKAVFFITGPYLKDHPELVRRMVEEGHEVGNHTIHHPSLPELSNEKLEEELVGLERAFYEKFGKHMRYLRPPKGEYSERTLAITKKLGYANLFWSFAYDDWYREKVRGADFAYQKVMGNLHNGAVLLLHAVSKDNADALDRIIRDAKAQGYAFKNISNIHEAEVLERIQE